MYLQKPIVVCIFTLFKKTEGDKYNLSFVLKHDPSLPLPTDPVNQCNPAIVPPEIASDGLPYFVFRWFYQKVPEEVKAVTGIDHVSLDFNPCGHPPIEIFGTPHYDFHIYLITPEERTCMTCAKLPGTPACDFNPGMQTTASGKGEQKATVASAFS